MGYHTTFTGIVNVDPPLTAAERAWVRSLQASVGEERFGRPGYFSPWEATTDGNLHVRRDYDRPRQAPEWLVWIMRELDDPLFSDREPQETPHTFSGTVDAQGGAEGDRYQLRVKDRAVTVHRSGLPCWPCWWSTLLLVPPSVAYAFNHPDEEHDPHVTDEVRAQLEPACRAGAWTPRQRYRKVGWPPTFVSWWNQHVNDRADAYWGLDKEDAG